MKDDYLELNQWKILQGTFSFEVVLIDWILEYQVILQIFVFLCTFSMWTISNFSCHVEIMRSIHPYRLIS